MKRYQLLVLHVVALFALAGCSNDDITQDKGTQESEDLTGMTEFAVKETPAPTSTRTMGIYSGSGIDFYWTSGDKLWINNPTATPALVESKKTTFLNYLQKATAKRPLPPNSIFWAHTPPQATKYATLATATR